MQWPAQSHNRTNDPRIYVQQYDNHGYPDNPASRARGRRSRRAQNEVLAVAGVLAGPEQDPQTIGQRWANRTGDEAKDEADDEAENDKIQQLIDESATGVILFLAQRVLFYSTYLCMVGVRNRSQVHLKRCVGSDLDSQEA